MRITGWDEEIRGQEGRKRREGSYVSPTESQQQPGMRRVVEINRGQEANGIYNNVLLRSISVIHQRHVMTDKVPSMIAVQTAPVNRQLNLNTGLLSRRDTFLESSWLA